MKVTKTIECYIDRTRFEEGFNTGAVFIPYDMNVKFDHKDFHKAKLTYEEEVPNYNIENFLKGITIARSLDNEITELKVSVGFYEALKSHVRKCFPPQHDIHGKGTLNVYGILITKGVE
jgi:hypothetical protein